MVVLICGSGSGFRWRALVTSGSNRTIPLSKSKTGDSVAGVPSIRFAESRQFHLPVPIENAASTLSRDSPTLSSGAGPRQVLGDARAPKTRIRLAG